MQFSAKNSIKENVNPIWSIDNTNIAQINQNGLLNTINSGIVQVTANYNGNIAKARILILAQ